MIRIFLLNIIITCFPFNAVKKTVELNGIDVNTRTISNQYNALNFNTGFIIVNKHKAGNFPNKCHVSAVVFDRITVSYSDYCIKYFKVLTESYRDKFEFFETGVSPPFSELS